MSKRANGLQRMAARVSDGPLGGCGEGFTQQNLVQQQCWQHRGAQEHAPGIGQYRT